jgi:acetyl-CoA synthetase
VRTSATSAFLGASDFLLENRSNYAVAYENFRWPQLAEFHWALDYFDVMAASNTRPTLIIASQDSADQSLSFDELSQRSNQVANFFRTLGISRGERILLMLGNAVALWETVLAAIKIGAVVVPTSSAISADDAKDRFERGRVRYVISNVACHDKFDSMAGKLRYCSWGGTAKHWIEYNQAYGEPAEFAQKDPTQATV